MTTDMDDRARPQGMSVTQEQFIQERDLLLVPKRDETARSLAEELVKLMELLAIHGSTGMGGRPDAHEAYVATLMGRIQAASRRPA